ncbi:MAG: hypothetical protein GX481_08810 [Atopobium sp.]|nr:hypothetical protein [Atopobium sp.]
MTPAESTPYGQRQIRALNKLLIVIDSFDDSENPNVLAGIAINADDMDDFLRDVGKLAVEKYGGATFEELVCEDENDSVADRTIAQSRKESADRVVSEAEEITKQALGKRGIARMPGDDPIEFFLRDYLDEFKNGIASESLMEDAHECGIATLAVEFRTAGLDAEDIEKAPVASWPCSRFPSYSAVCRGISGASAGSPAPLKTRSARAPCTDTPQPTWKTSTRQPDSGCGYLPMLKMSRSRVPT